MLMIRLQRTGRKNDPSYRIAVLEKARAARTGRILEALGSYNPKTKAFSIDESRTKEWVGHGAQPTDTLKNLLITKGVLEGKKADAFPLSARKSARAAAAKAAADAAVAQKAEADAALAAPAAEEAAAAEPAPEPAPEASVEAAPEAPAEPEAAPAPAEEETAAAEEPAA